MAVRRDILAAIGGFDPSYRYFLDETDLNMRLAAEGHSTAVVPLAEVHHGYLANNTRKTTRAPSDLFEIGASYAVFLRKHCVAERHEQALSLFRAQQRKRALEFMKAGALEPRDVRRLMKRLSLGMEEGKKRSLGALPALARAAEGFRAFPSAAGAKHVVISGRRCNARRLREEAALQASQGNIVSLFLLSRTALYHRVRFSEDGYWEQIGGLFGRSERDQPLFRVTSFGKRVEAEKLRVSEQRGLFANNSNTQEVE